MWRFKIGMQENKKILFFGMLSITEFGGGLGLVASDKRWSWMRFGWALFLVAFPNLLMSYLASSNSVERPWLNVDYVLVLLIFIIGYRYFAGFVLLVILFFDVLAMVGQVLPVLRLADIFYVSSFIGIAPVKYQLMAAGLIGILGLFFFVLLNKKNSEMKNELLVCVNLVVGIYLYQVLIVGPEGGQVWSDDKKPLVASQTVFGFNSRRTGFVDSLYVKGDLFGPVKLAGASGEWLSDMRQNDKILLIVSESWGAAHEDIQQAVLQPLLRESDHLNSLNSGVLSFKGITVEAEIRELCHSDLLHFNFEDHKGELADCLPNRLKKEGYSTHAFHGAAGLMYDRVRWYPDIGFQSATFFESRSWPRRCFSFPGACDSDIADQVARTFSQSSKVFVYWLTLNSHHAYDSRDIRGEMLDCKMFGLAQDSQACRNLTLHRQFFSDIGELVQNPEMQGVRVLIVGDHEPPITDDENKNEYFMDDKVPWISFQINDDFGVYVHR